MYGLLKEVQQHVGVTALHITHSRGDANELADRLFVLQDGRIQRIDAVPSDLDDLDDIEESEERIGYEGAR